MEPVELIVGPTQPIVQPVKLSMNPAEPIRDGDIIALHATFMHFVIVML